MKVVVTSGPTREPVDDVRFISNVSSGRLGCSVATAFSSAGHQVRLLSGPGALIPPECETLVVEEITTATSLLDALTREVESVSPPDLLVHAAAVADYAPIKAEGKIKSTEPELLLRMAPTPKVVDGVRRLAPNLAIILFKLESGIDRDELHRRARAAMARVGGAAVVANLLDEVGVDGHRADLLRADGSCLPLDGREAIATSLVTEAERIVLARREAT